MREGDQRGDTEGRGQATETRTESRAQSSPWAPPGHALWAPGHPPSSGVLSAFHLALLDASRAIARVGEQECWPRACSPTGLPVASVPLLWSSKGLGLRLPSPPSVQAPTAPSVLEGSTVGTPTGGASLLSLVFHTHSGRTVTARRSLGTLRGPGAPWNTARSPTGAPAPTTPWACLAVQSPCCPSRSVTPPLQAKGAFPSAQHQARVLGPEGSLGQDVGTLGGPGRRRCPLRR